MTELREYIDWLVKQQQSNVQRQIYYRSDFDDPNVSIERKLKALMRGVEEANEELLEQLYHKEEQIKQLKERIELREDL